MRIMKWAAGWIVLGTLLVGSTDRARGGVVLVTNPAALGANDSIDWGQLGPDSTALPSSVTVKSAAGLSVTASTTDPAGLIRLDEGTSWTGNFTIGDHLLNNNSTDYFPLTITFASPIFGAGANIQLDNQTSFTASIEAFSGTKSLGTFTEDGVSNSNEDGSVIFIGVLDTKAEITSLVFGISDPPSTNSDFAVNGLRLKVPAVSVPEPSSLILCASGGILIIGASRRRRRV